MQGAEVVRKVAQRSLGVRASLQGLCARIRLCNSHLASMLLHRGRFAELDAVILKRMRHATQGLTKGPWMALPPIALGRARELELEVEVRHLQADDTAARVRLATQSDAIKRLSDDIEATRNSDEATPSPWRPWRDAMPIMHLGQFRARCVGPGPLREVRVQDMTPSLRKSRCAARAVGAKTIRRRL